MTPLATSPSSPGLKGGPISPGSSLVPLPPLTPPFSAAAACSQHAGPSQLSPSPFQLAQHLPLRTLSPMVRRPRGGMCVLFTHMCPALGMGPGTHQALDPYL